MGTAKEGVWVEVARDADGTPQAPAQDQWDLLWSSQIAQNYVGWIGWGAAPVIRDGVEVFPKYVGHLVWMPPRDGATVKTFVDSSGDTMFRA